MNILVIKLKQTNNLLTINFYAYEKIQILYDACLAHCWHGSFDSKIQRLYVSMGSEGVVVREDGVQTQIEALPAHGIVNATGAGDALLAGIVHAGPDASAVDAARFGQKCARCSLQSPDAVSDQIKMLKL